MFKSYLILDSVDSTIINSKYRFNLNNFRIDFYKLKKYVINNIDMTTAKYLCCDELAKFTLNRNIDGTGNPTNIIGLITDDIEISNNNHSLAINKKNKLFKHLTLSFKDSQGNLVQPDDFVVVFEIIKDAD